MRKKIYFILENKIKRPFKKVGQRKRERERERERERRK